MIVHYAPLTKKQDPPFRVYCYTGKECIAHHVLCLPALSGWGARKILLSVFKAKPEIKTIVLVLRSGRRFITLTREEVFPRNKT